MKELLKDQAKFRAKLDRVVRKIETSSQRTAKLSERNKNRGKQGGGDGAAPTGGAGAVESHESTKVHGDKLNAYPDETEAPPSQSASRDVHDGDDQNHAGAISARAAW